MTGTGLYTITGSAVAKSQGKGGSGNAAGGLAAGGYISAGTGPTADDVPIMASKGELVVPAHMVASGAADSMRGQIPGFASGGVVGGNLTPAYLTGMFSSFEKAVTAAMVTAMRAAIAAAEHLKGSIPGFASGGVVGGAQAILSSAIASKGSAYLKAWTGSKEPTINAQITTWTKDLSRDSALAGAGGLTRALHAHYAAAKADDKKNIASLTTERQVMRDWRTALTGSDSSLSSWIKAAGSTAALKSEVAAWKKQLASQKATIAGISKMLGLTPAEQQAAAASAAAAAAICGEPGGGHCGVIVRQQQHDRRRDPGPAASGDRRQRDRQPGRDRPAGRDGCHGGRLGAVRGGHVLAGRAGHRAHAGLGGRRAVQAGHHVRGIRRRGVPGRRVRPARAADRHHRRGARRGGRACRRRDRRGGECG